MMVPKYERGASERASAGSTLARRRIPPRMQAKHGKQAGAARHGLHHSKDNAKGSGRAEAARRARRDRMVLEHLSLVHAIAVRHQQHLPVHVDLDDLEHAGVLGLFDAATRFTPEKHVAFSSYAQHRIKGAILDSLRQLDCATRNMRRRQKQVEAAANKLACVLQRNPTESEIAESLGLDAAQWRAATLDLQPISLISASTRAQGNENDDAPAPDFPCHPDLHPDSICAREQLRGVLAQAMQSLPRRHQQVVQLYYTDQMTMREIGGVLGVNESRVSQIHKSALGRMAEALAANGITSTQMF